MSAMMREYVLNNSRLLRPAQVPPRAAQAEGGRGRRRPQARVAPQSETQVLDRAAWTYGSARRGAGQSRAGVGFARGQRETARPETRPPRPGGLLERAKARDRRPGAQPESKGPRTVSGTGRPPSLSAYGSRTRRMGRATGAPSESGAEGSRFARNHLSAQCFRRPANQRPLARREETTNEGPGAAATASNSGAFRWSGRLDLNQRPLAPQATDGRVDGVAPGGSASQGSDFADGRGGAGSDAVAPVGPRGTDFGAPAVRDAGSGSLLTVAEVARRLAVCRATVYRICREGRLRHIRISNSIRVPPGALETYLRSCERS